MTRVALVKGDDRRANVRRALELIESDIEPAGRTPLIKVNFVSTRAPLCATHPDAVRAVVEFLRDRGARDIAVAESAAIGNTPRGFEAYGYMALAEEYGLELIDLNEAEELVTVYIVHPDFRPHAVRLAGPLLDDRYYVVSLTPLKTHGATGVTLTAKNMAMGAVHVCDKYRMHPSSAGLAVLDTNIFLVLQHLHVELAVLDGFQGMEGNGPVDGDPVDHRVALAGTDFVAADRVGCEVMGVDFADIRHLNFLCECGAGEGDLEKIEVAGHSIEECRRPYRPPPRYLRMRRQLEKGMYQGLAVHWG